MNTSKKKVVGYCVMSKKKLQSPNWNQFLSLMRERGDIALRELDLTTPPEEWGELDLVITKFNRELQCARTTKPDPKSIAILNNFETYMGKNPQIIQIDPLECQKKLISRSEMLHYFKSLCDKMTNLHIPQSLVLAEGEALPSDFPFPAICKSLEATAHTMAIIWKKEDLTVMKRPLLVQELINHNSTIFKYYLIGDYVYVAKRPSIKNIQTNLDNGESILYFGQGDANYKSLQGEPTADDLSEEFVEQLKQILIDKDTDVRLNLIGVDIIQCSSTGHYYIIDANYFPGYSDVPDFPLQFLSLILEKLKVNSN